MQIMLFRMVFEPPLSALRLDSGGVLYLIPHELFREIS
jgi:hypothetical protein